MSGVVLLGLGGTISMLETPCGAKPFRDAGTLADQVGGFAAAEDLALVGGSEVDFELLERLVSRCERLVATGVAGIVVTTGTDSIEEVSVWLAYRRNWPVPIAVTGAMVTGGRPDSDGPANLADARFVAASGIDTDPVVVFGGSVFAAREVLKVSGTAREAFGAPGRGTLAIVGNGEIHWYRRLARRGAHAAPSAPIRPVPIVTAALGDDGRVLAVIGEGQPAVVVAANGAGNLPPAQAVAAERLLEAGTLVVITTRAPDARVAPRYGYRGGGAGLSAAGAQFASGLSPHRARLLLSLGIAQGLDRNGLRALVETESE
ncbi:MAG: asparaginase [Nocardia sp.]|nr:asparaginase [Nocardia sp.]